MQGPRRPTRQLRGRSEAKRRHPDTDRRSEPADLPVHSRPVVPPRPTSVIPKRPRRRRPRTTARSPREMRARLSIDARRPPG
jgi:hypothetical protein